MFMYPPHLMCHQDIFQKYQLTNWQKNRCNAVGNLHSFAAATMVLLTVPEYSFKCIKGVRRAAWECRSRFRDERWNCPDLFDQLQIHLVKSKSIFSTGTSSIYLSNVLSIITVATKKAGYANAIIAASIKHSVSLACQKGEIPMNECTSGNNENGYELNGPLTERQRRNLVTIY